MEHPQDGHKSDWNVGGKNKNIYNNFISVCLLVYAWMINIIFMCFHVVTKYVNSVQVIISEPENFISEAVQLMFAKNFIYPDPSKNYCPWWLKDMCVFFIRLGFTSSCCFHTTLSTGHSSCTHFVWSLLSHTPMGKRGTFLIFAPSATLSYKKPQWHILLCSSQPLFLRS